MDQKDWTRANTNKGPLIPSGLGSPENPANRALPYLICFIMVLE
jgi:hypothetical protein